MFCSTLEKLDSVEIVLKAQLLRVAEVAALLNNCVSMNKSTVAANNVLWNKNQVKPVVIGEHYQAYKELVLNNCWKSLIRSQTEQSQIHLTN